MAKRQRSSSLSEPCLDASRHRVLRNSDEGIEIKPCIQDTFSAGDIRSTVLALIECCTPGVWLRILPLDEDDQAAVEKEHVKKTCDVDSLARSVLRAWDKRLNPIVFSRVADRLLKVLDLIVEDDGGNDFVEDDRGKPCFSDPVAAPAEGVAKAYEDPEAPDFVDEHEDEL